MRSSKLLVVLRDWIGAAVAVTLLLLTLIAAESYYESDFDFDVYGLRAFATSTHLGILSVLAMPIEIVIVLLFMGYLRTPRRNLKWWLLLAVCSIGALLETVCITRADLGLLYNMDKYGLPVIFEHGLFLPGISPWGGQIVTSAGMMIALTAIWCVRNRSQDVPSAPELAATTQV